MFSNLDALLTAELSGKSVLITGAAGTIGAALVDRLLGYGLRSLRLLDHNEEKTFYLGLRYKEERRVRVLLGDVQDRSRMARAMHGIDVVIHTAALKHVGVGEYNPFMVVRTNLVALQDLIECSIDAGVGRFVFTSSDKAVNPTNVMGGSKFIGERLVTCANLYRGHAPTIFSSTRFGNVLGSAGSVVPVFQRQIEAGGPMTVTDPSMTRFFMTLEEAVDLVLGAVCGSIGGEIFIPKMHAVRLQDLAEGMIELLAPRGGIAIETIGRRPGEKDYEELFSDHEREHCLETDRMFILKPILEELRFDELVSVSGSYPDNPRPVTQTYSSHTTACLKKSAVCQLLRSHFKQSPTAQRAAA